MKQITDEEWRKLALKRHYENLEGFNDGAETKSFYIPEEKMELIEMHVARIQAVSGVPHQTAMSTFVNEIIKRHLSDPKVIKKHERLIAKRAAKKKGGAS